MSNSANPGDPANPTGGSDVLDRAVILLAALICFFAAAMLRDTPLHALSALLPAPPMPSTMVDRDAQLAVRVSDEAERPTPGAAVRVFAVRDDKVYFAGEVVADASGMARFDELPRGEVWVLAYGAGRARASTRLILEQGLREVRLTLRPATVLDVLVVDEADRPVDGAQVHVTTGDPLPHTATTQGGGRARFDRLGKAPYVVRASFRGYDDTVRKGVVPGPVPLRLKLDRLATLEVHVVAMDGTPAAEATVLAAGSHLWPARKTITNAEGIARIGGLQGGVYDLRAELGDQVSPTELMTVKRGEEKRVLLLLELGRHVRVTVTDGEGEAAPPIKDASAVLAESGLSSFPLVGRTNGEGVVVLGPIAAKSATVSVRAQGFVPKSAVPVGEFDTDIRVSLLRGGVLLGEVVDDRDYPVAGATIEVVGVDIDGMPISETTAMSDFREDHFDFAMGGPAPLIPMGELGVMPGPIPDLPREGFLIGLVSSASRGGDPWVTNSDGTFRAEPVPPGRVHAIVRHPDYVEGISETVTIRPGGEAKVRVVLHNGGSIEGRVLDADRNPVPGARIELAALHGSLERLVFAADDGTFAFGAVPDEVLLSVSRPESPGDVAARLVVEVPPRERKEVEIVLPKVRDTVRIRVSDDRGYPLDRVEIRATSLELAEPLRRTLFTNEDGDAELPNAVGLKLRLVLLLPGKAPRIEHLERAPDKLELTLNKGIEARGVVTARQGRDRIGGAEVTIYLPSGVHHTRSDGEGAFVFQDLAPGRARITALHPEYAPAEKTVTIGESPDHPTDLGEIDLAEAGEAEGVVVDERDEPVAGARVARDRVPTYLPLGPLPPGVVAADREGRFLVRGLPEGDVTLEAYFADLGRGSSDPVSIRAGRTTSRVKIVLPGGAAAQREPKGTGSIAITLGERTENNAKTVVIVMVPPGGEAEIAGIEPGDRLLRVNDILVRSIEEARRRLTGPLSEDVLLTLAPAEMPLDSTKLLRVRRERVRR